MSIVGSRLEDRRNYRNKVVQDTVVIAAGSSLSPAIDVGNLSLIGVYTPSGMTAADLTFQASHDGTTYYEVRDATGLAYTHTNAVGGGYRPVDVATFVGPRFIKIRSGTSGTPVNQVSAATLNLVFREI